MEPQRRIRIRARVREFALPPITDGLVIGTESPIGAVAVGRALELLTVARFEHVPVEDDILGDVLIRAPLLRKVSEAEIQAFLFDRIRPVMGPEEIVDLQLEVEVEVGDEQA
ncbi:hypothetical protein [Thiohalospira sp.]|uniref:hypothetical protein n=1 Tax=Thiohalospira sp. TaxID=3080549 RepID=UPI0039804F67